MSETWTVLRLLTWTTDYLQKHGSESPRLDAEVLLAAARGCERIMLYAAFDEVVSDELRAKFRDLVKRRAEGVPVAYLVGKKEFYSLALRVTPDVLIPRPETESVVVAVLDAMKGSGFRVQGSGEAVAIADVGTGSGAIAIAVAKHAPQAQVIAVDISPAALEIAKANAAQHGLSERIEFAQGDLLAALPPQPRFAVIASNPPYVSESEFAALSPQVKNHEPRQVPQAAERLLPGGWLIVELSPMIAQRVVELIATDSRYEPAALMKDLAGLARVVKARHSG
jgi:release factor glutamine methyltransferase